jgi:glycosyltransferase involved in cell wall biosynthesis
MSTLPKKVRILIAAGFYYPAQIGGPANSLYWLATASGEVGIDVTVAAMDIGISKGTVVVGKWIKTSYGKVKYHRTQSLNFPLRYLSGVLSASRKADIIMLNSLFAPSSFLLGILLSLSGKKIIWSVRGELSEAALSIKPWIKKNMLGLLNTLGKKITLHVTSEAEQKQASTLLPQFKNFQIPNYYLLPHKLDSSVQQKLLFVGRLHPIKAIDRLIDGCALSEKFMQSNFILQIAGDDTGAYAETLKSKVKELGLVSKVIFLGQVNDAGKKQHMYAESYFNFLVSDSENFGNTVIESLAQGTPVVASTGTPWKLLSEKSAGFWVDNSATALASTIDTIITMHSTQYAAFRKNAQALADSEFDIRKHIYLWKQVFQKIHENKY